MRSDSSKEDMSEDRSSTEAPGFVARLFNFRSSTELKKKEEERQAAEAVPLNHINELQILQGHTDIVRLLLKIDDNR